VLEKVDENEEHKSFIKEESENIGPKPPLEDSRNLKQDTSNAFTSADLKNPNENGAVEIHESDDDIENKENIGKDDKTPEKEANETLKKLTILPKRTKSDQLGDLPPNVLAVNDVVELKGSGKKKGKSKGLPKAIKRVFPNCTDLGAWRKRNRLTHKTKIFKMFGNYSIIKKNFHERGWVENKDRNSPCFDVLWTLRQRDIDYESLREGQIVNHFRYNGVITTKVGL